MLGIERREVLREPLAQPLLVVIAPADRLAPPLVRHFVRQEELGEPFEVRRIVRQRSGVFGSGWFSAAK